MLRVIQVGAHVDGLRDVRSYRKLVLLRFVLLQIEERIVGKVHVGNVGIDGRLREI